MNKEYAFLQAIVENPDDDLLRLIFADWLDEQGDPRADAFRAHPEVGRFLADLVRVRLAKLPSLLQLIDNHAASGQEALLRGLAQVLKPLRDRADLHPDLPRKVLRVLDHLSEYGFGLGGYPLTDSLACGVFAAGLAHGALLQDEVVAWADRQIEARENLPAWLMDLSLSAGSRLEDTASSLRILAEPISGLDICRAFYALLPEAAGTQLADAERLAGVVYAVARSCLKGDWSYRLLRRAEDLRESFALMREGFSGYLLRDLTRELRDFVAEYRDDDVRAWLHPVQVRAGCQRRQACVKQAGGPPSRARMPNGRK